MAAERDSLVRGDGAGASARSRSCRPGVSTTTGPAPSSTRGRPGPRCTRGTSPRRGSTSGVPPGCGPCSPTRCPWCRSRPLLELARCYITLADPGGAAAVLTQAHDILQQRPDLGVLPQRAAELRSKLATIKAGAVGPSSLTAAELRLLPLLSTHLSFREIGERLFVSSHTVKSQAYSMYRKLGVSSRSEAVARARELGLDAPLGSRRRVRRRQRNRHAKSMLRAVSVRERSKVRSHANRIAPPGRLAAGSDEGERSPGGRAPCPAGVPRCDLPWREAARREKRRDPGGDPTLPSRRRPPASGPDGARLASRSWQPRSRRRACRTGRCSGRGSPS